MAAMINGFWIILSAMLLIGICALVVLGLCLGGREAEKERERSAEIARVEAIKLDMGGYTERELDEITNRLLREDRKRPRRYFGRVCRKGYGFSGYKPGKKRSAYGIISKCGRFAA